MRTFAVTLGFAPARILREGIKRYYATCTGRPVEHILWDQHYPLGYDTNALRDLCEQFNLSYEGVGEDIGLHRGFNAACTILDAAHRLRNEDVIICYDPDSGPVTQGWDYGIGLAMAIDPTLGICAISNPRTESELLRTPVIKEQGGAVRRVTQPIVLGVAGWRWGFLKQAGGFQQPRPYYGHLESAMWPHLTGLGYHWGVLADHREEEDLRDQKDREYAAWQWEESHTQRFKGSFKEFLEAGCPAHGVPDRIP